MRKLLTATVVVLGAGAAWAVWVYDGEWGGRGTGPGHFLSPSGIAVGADGTVYVGDCNNRRVQYFTPTGSLKGQWQGLYPSVFWVRGVAVAPTGYVYVTTDSHNVQYFTSTGSSLGGWDNDFRYPEGIAVSPITGYVYVADWGNSQVQYFTPRGEFLGKWGSYGAGPGEFNKTTGVTFIGGNVYVGDWMGDRVQYFTPAGGYLGGWGSTGTGNGQFKMPWGIAGRPGNSAVYVCDLNNNRVQYFTLAGSFLGKFGSQGPGPGEFGPRNTGSPCYCTFSANGNRLYVVDNANCRVQYFRWSDVNIAPASLGKIKATFR